MGTLDQVLQLKRQGVSDQEIVRTLQQGGLSPVEIESTMQQASIKGAVSQISGDVPTMQQPNFDYNGMQPSLLDSMQGSQPAQEQDEYIPQPGEAQPTAFASEPQGGYYQPQTQEFTQDYSQAPQQGQEYYEAYQPGTFDSGTITEIAEQVVQDKTNEIKLQLSDLSEFKAVLKAQVEHMDLRLQRMEQLIDKLQMSLLDKVGNYVGGIDNIKKEMEMMQDSFGKVISDKENLHRLRAMAHKTPRQKQTTEKKTVTIIHKKAKESPKKTSKKKRR